jgi:Holliday junction resolvase RusA-like endonuclease
VSEVIFATKVPGRPVPWSRTGGNGSVRFTPKKVRDWEKAAAAVFSASTRVRDFDGPVRLQVTTLHPRPKRLKTGGRQWFTPRPDTDNLIKAVADSLEKSKVIRNDSQICSVSASKFYADSGEEPGVEVVLKRLA